MNVLKVMKSFLKKFGSRVKDSEIVANGESLACMAWEAEIRVFRKYPEHGEKKSWESIIAFELDSEAPHEFDGLDLSYSSVVSYGNVVSFESKEIASALEFVSLACDVESTRYALGGPLFTGQNIVATDGRRMHVAKELSADFPESDRNIVPQKACDFILECCKLSKEVAFSFDPNRLNVIFHDCGIVCSFRLIEGRFPAWKRVIPEKTERSERFVVSEAIAKCRESVKRTTLENKLKKSKLTKAEKKSWSDHAPEFKIADVTLDASFVADALATAKENEFTLKYSGPKDACVIEDEKRLVVVMPLSK